MKEKVSKSCNWSFPPVVYIKINNIQVCFALLSLFLVCRLVRKRLACFIQSGTDWLSRVFLSLTILPCFPRAWSGLQALSSRDKMSLCLDLAFAFDTRFGRALGTGWGLLKKGNSKSLECFNSSHVFIFSGISGR